MAPGNSKRSVIVTIDDSRMNDIQQVADECRAAGLEVRHSLTSLGQIAGEIEPEKQNQLRQVRGVTSVEEAAEYQLPPPESDVQ